MELMSMLRKRTCQLPWGNFLCNQLSTMCYNVVSAVQIVMEKFWTIIIRNKMIWQAASELGSNEKKILQKFKKERIWYIVIDFFYVQIYDLKNAIFMAVAVSQGKKSEHQKRCILICFGASPLDKTTWVNIYS